jgi:hypothetical protein
MYNDLPDVLMGDIFVEAARMAPEPEPEPMEIVIPDKEVKNEGDNQKEIRQNYVSKSSATLISELPDRVKFFALNTSPSSSSTGTILLCDACGIQLRRSAIFIRCAECTSPVVDLCVHCFGNGAEFGSHFRHHAYTVVSGRLSQLLRQSRPVCKLDIRGLLRFMEAVEAKGSFNFSELEKTLNVLPGDGEKLYLELIAMLSSCDEQLIASSQSSEPSQADLDNTMGGGPANFNVLRDEFEHEYVPEAETLLAAVSASADPAELESLFEGYNGTLDERERRRKVMKNANMLNLKEYYSVLKRRKTDERDMFEKLRMFVRPVGQSPFAFLESLATVLTLRKRQMERVKRLAQLKQNGIRSELAEAVQFDSDRKKRAEIISKKSKKIWTALPPVLNGGMVEKKDPISAEEAVRLLPTVDMLDSAEAVAICVELLIAPQHYLVTRAAVLTILKKRENIEDSALFGVIQEAVFGTIRRYLLAAQGLPVSAFAGAPASSVEEMKLKLVQHFRRSFDGT